MPTKRSTEQKLYPIVEKYICKRFGCIATDINRGTKYGRIDVIGITDLSGDLSSRHELVGVEVKAGYQPFGAAAGQAHGYSIYANRCYLADKRSGTRPYTNEEIDIASTLNIGLLAIIGKNVKEILAAPLMKPIEHLQLEIIEKIGFSKCTICDGIFRREAGGNWGANISTAGLNKAAERERGLAYWLYNAARAQSDSRSSVYTRRYICLDCVKAISDHE